MVDNLFMAATFLTAVVKLDLREWFDSLTESKSLIYSF